MLLLVNAAGTPVQGLQAQYTLIDSESWGHKLLGKTCSVHRVCVVGYDDA